MFKVRNSTGLDQIGLGVSGLRNSPWMGHLDGDVAVEVGIASQIDPPEAPLPENPADLVAANCRRDGLRRGVRHALGRSHNGGCVLVVMLTLAGNFRGQSSRRRGRRDLPGTPAVVSAAGSDFATLATTRDRRPRAPRQTIRAHRGNAPPTPPRGRADGRRPAPDHWLLRRYGANARRAGLGRGLEIRLALVHREPAETSPEVRSPRRIQPAIFEAPGRGQLHDLAVEHTAPLADHLNNGTSNTIVARGADFRKFSAPTSVTNVPREVQEPEGSACLGSLHEVALQVKRTNTFVKNSLVTDAGVQDLQTAPPDLHTVCRFVVRRQTGSQPAHYRVNCSCEPGGAPSCLTLLLKPALPP